MKKKSLKLHKVTISNLDSIVGGEPVKTYNCVVNPSDTHLTAKGECQIETWDTPCGGSNGCQSDFTCAPSNWGWNCQYTLFNC